MKAIISLGGTPLSKERFDSIYEPGDYIIGVDSGCQFLYDYDIEPDLILGDFDSIEPSLLNWYKDKGVPMKVFPAIKNETDGELALIEGKKICDKLLLIGTGGLIETDHFLGNIFLLTLYPNAEIVLEKEWLKAISKGTYVVDKVKGGLISLVPLETSNIVLDGFEYDGDIKTDLGYTLTLRNQIKDTVGKVRVIYGKMLLIQGKK